MQTDKQEKAPKPSSNRPCACKTACYCGSSCDCDETCLCPTWDRDQ